MWQIWVSLFLSVCSTIITLYVVLIERPQLNNENKSTINKMAGKISIQAKSIQGQQEQINKLKTSHDMLVQVKEMLAEQQKSNREQLKLINTVLANQKDNT